MKVVLFCGGYGMRMRDGASDLHRSGNRPWMVWDRDRDRAPFVGPTAHDRDARCSA